LSPLRFNVTLEYIFSKVHENLEAIKSNGIQYISFWSKLILKKYLVKTQIPQESNSVSYTVIYISAIFDEKVIWRLHIEMIEAKAFRTFIRIYSLFKSERLSINIKLTIRKALIRSNMTYACPAWEFAADNHLLKLQRQQNKVLLHHWKFSKVHTDSRFAHGFQTSVCI
jgi:hypothetical protein